MLNHIITPYFNYDYCNSIQRNFTEFWATLTFELLVIMTKLIELSNILRHFINKSLHD